MYYRAEYKTVTGELLDVEFEHDFDGQTTVITQAQDLTHGVTMYQLYVGYLIYNSIRELQGV
jgi:hypothetical protein